MITIGDFLIVICIFIAIKIFVWAISTLVKKGLKTRNLNEGKGYTLMKLASYLLYAVGVVVGLELVGLDLTPLVTVFAALLVGLGFGVQHLFLDIVSGFVILFEGIIKVGDIIELDGDVSKVRQIDIRTTKVENREGNFIIIPNSEITSKHLMNWSFNEVEARHSIQVGVAYGSDTALVKRLLEEVAKKHVSVKKGRRILVVFQGFGDSSLDFELRFWTTNNWEMDLILSEMRFSIDQTFRENNVKIPFPQRDIHVIDSKAGL
ncbi:MAG: mechanosensitive ion channel family protein [Flavobacteriales bacterium]